MIYTALRASMIYQAYGLYRKKTVQKRSFFWLPELVLQEFAGELEPSRLGIQSCVKREPTKKPRRLAWFLVVVTGQNYNFTKMKICEANQLSTFSLFTITSYLNSVH